MTNGAVNVRVDQVDGAKIVVAFNGGEKSITVDKSTPIVAIESGGLGDLMAGAEARQLDPYLLAHRDKDHLLSAEHYKRVYRNQGWISPVVLIDGSARTDHTVHIGNSHHQFGFPAA